MSIVQIFLSHKMASSSNITFQCLTQQWNIALLYHHNVWLTVYYDLFLTKLSIWKWVYEGTGYKMGMCPLSLLRVRSIDAHAHASCCKNATWSDSHRLTLPLRQPLVCVKGLLCCQMLSWVGSCHTNGKCGSVSYRCSHNLLCQHTDSFYVCMYFICMCK